MTTSNPLLSARLHGYVQAGGGSTRFGRDKALADLGGHSLLARTASLLAAVCPSVQIVAAAGKYPDPPAPLLRDLWPGEGPLGGIVTALHDLPAAASERHVALILSCDMPFLTPDFLAALASRALQSPAPIVAPLSSFGLEPLCACWRSDALPVLEAAFSSGIRKVTQAMKLLPMETLDDSFWKRFDTQGRLFWNMNTGEDYDEARRLLDAQHP